MNTSVSINEAVHLIRTCGTDNTFIFQGEPVIGKSAMLKMLGDQLNLPTRYFDCALLDLGDLQMPKVSDTSVSFVPNELFLSDEPCIYMFDEAGKAMRPVQNALLPAFYEHRLGNYKFPKGSIVFGTTNLATDGVGDMIQAHAKNRVTFLNLRKPTADEWIEWGVNNGVAPEVMAWVHEYPHCMSSYTEDTDEAKDNPYIFYPTKGGAFVSPRSLAHASNLIKQRANLTDEVLIAALSGTIGESAARDMQAFLSVADTLPSFDSIVRDPAKASVPNSPIACAILALGAVARVTQDTANAWMSYLVRLPYREVQFMFAQNAMRSSKAKVLMKAQGFTDWARENSWAI